MTKAAFSGTCPPPSKRPTMPLMLAGLCVGVALLLAVGRRQLGGQFDELVGSGLSHEKVSFDRVGLVRTVGWVQGAASTAPAGSGRCDASGNPTGSAT